MKQKTNKEKPRGQMLPPKFAGIVCAEAHDLKNHWSPFLVINSATKHSRRKLIFWAISDT